MTVTHTWSGAGLSPAALTTSTAGTGDNAFNTVNGSGLSVVNSGTRPPRLQLAKPAGASSYCQWDGMTGRAAGALRFYWVSPTSAPSSSFSLIRVKDGTNACFQINFLTSGTVRILDQSGAQVAQATVGSTPFDGTRYRIEARWTHNGTNGNITVTIYSGDTMTVLATITANPADLLTQHTLVQFGLQNTTPEVATFYMDDLAIANNNALIGPFASSNTPPTVNAGSDQTVDAADSVTLTAAGSDVDGSIASYAWAQISGPAVTLSGTGNTRTFNAPTAQTDSTLVFRATVTDDQGATGTDDVTVTVNKHRWWIKTAGGTLSPLWKQGQQIADTPVAATVTATAGDTTAQVSWSINPGSHTVNSLTTTRSGGGTTQTHTSLTGTRAFNGLTNGTTYTITVTLTVDGVVQTPITRTVTPQAATVTGEPLPGIYNGQYGDAAAESTFNVPRLPMTSSYVQWGSNKSALPTFPGYDQTKEFARADKGVPALFNWTAKYSDLPEWVADTTHAQHAFGLSVIAAVVTKFKARYDHAPDVPLWVAFDGECDAATNQARTDIRFTGVSAQPDTFGKYLTEVIRQFHLNAPGIMVGLWYAGTRTDWILSCLQNVTQRPDWIGFDPYVNGAYETPAQNFGVPYGQLFNPGPSPAKGIYRDQKVRLDNLTRLAGRPAIIPLCIPEHGISKQNPRTGAAVNTDTQMANYINLIQEGMASFPNPIPWALYFNRDSGDNGMQRVDDGSHPLAVAAMHNEMLAGITP